MRLLNIAVISFMLAACGTSPESRYYALSEAQPAAAPTPATAPWAVDKVSVPELLNRPQMVRKSGANGIDILEYDRWAEPLDSAAARILTLELAARKTPYAPPVPPPVGANPPVPLPPAPPQKHVAVTINEFDADEAGHVSLNARWTVEADGNAPHDFSQTVTADTRSISSVVAAMSGLLGSLADAIAAQL